MCALPSQYYSPLLHTLSRFFFFFFNDTATTEIYTLSLHDALPILVGEALELERHAPQDVGASRDPDAPQRLERLTGRRRMADRGVARERLHVVDGALVRAAGERALHAAVLVAERDLQVQDVLAVALKTEMSGLDDPGVYGA